MSFDAYDQAFLADPYPTYKTLRASTPVFYDDTWDLTFVAGHGDVSDILKDRQRFGRDFRHRLDIEEVDHDLHHRIYPPRWPTWTRYIRESFIDLEPPRHTRLRRLVAKAFTRRSSEAFRSQLEDAANGILDRILVALATDPTAYAALRQGDVGVGTAVDELLRFDSPLQMFERWVLEDTEIHDRPLRKGTKVGLLFGSANHDESAFSKPDRLDLSRDPNPHFSFGAGLHYCVGAPLAKVELEAAIGTFAKRVSAIDLVEARDRIESLVFRGVGRLEVALQPA